MHKHSNKYRHPPPPRTPLSRSKAPFTNTPQPSPHLPTNRHPTDTKHPPSPGWVTLTQTPQVKQDPNNGWYPPSPHSAGNGEGTPQRTASHGRPSPAGTHRAAQPGPQPHTPPGATDRRSTARRGRTGRPRPTPGSTAPRTTPGRPRPREHRTPPAGRGPTAHKGRAPRGPRPPPSALPARGAPKSPPPRSPPGPGPPRGGSRSARGLLLTRSPPGSSPRALSAAPFFRAGPAPPTPRAGGREGGRKGRRRRGAAGPVTGMGCARPAAARPEETPESPRAATGLPARRPLPPRPAPWYGPPGADWHGAPHTRARRWYGPPSPPPPAALTQCLRGGVPRRTGRARSAAAQPFSAAAGPRAVRAERLPRAAENRHFHPSAVATLRALPTREPALVRPASPLGTSLRPVPGRLNRAGPPLERPAPPAALGPVLPHHVRRGLPRQPPPPRSGAVEQPSPPARWFGPRGRSHGAVPRCRPAAAAALTAIETAKAPQPRAAIRHGSPSLAAHCAPLPPAGPAATPRAPSPAWAGMQSSATCPVSLGRVRPPWNGNRSASVLLPAEGSRGAPRRPSIGTAHNVELCSPPGLFCSSTKAFYQPAR